MTGGGQGRPPCEYVSCEDMRLVFSSECGSNNCTHIGERHQDLMSSGMKSTQNSAGHVGDNHETFPAIMRMMSPKVKGRKRRM